MRKVCKDMSTNQGQILEIQEITQEIILEEFNQGA
jgi:hypothetical protein